MDSNMQNERTAAEELFLLGLNDAIVNSRVTGSIDSVKFTVLADLMQIQCLKSNDTELLNFTLPTGIIDVVIDIATAKDSKHDLLTISGQDNFQLKFKSEQDQDKFLSIFLTVSFQGLRAYSTPDIFLGKPQADKFLCDHLLQILSEVVKRDLTIEKLSEKVKEASDLINIQCGAMFYKAKINQSDFFATPDFDAFDQPVRCYLVEYKNGYSRFFWSKPGEYGAAGMFVTKPLIEGQPKNGERYFNDAYYEDPNKFSVTLTITNQMVHDGQGFMYRQEFSDWMGAFMGNLNPVHLSAVPDTWLEVFRKNSRV